MQYVLYTKHALVEATMLLNLNRSLIPNNITIVLESLIWNTLIPSRPKLTDDIDNSDDNEIEDDDDDEDDDLSQVPVEREETDYTC